MKLIYPLGKPHSVQRSLITNPPKGYCFMKSIEELEKPSISSRYQKIKNKLSYNPLLKGVWEFAKKFYNPVIRRYNSFKYLDFEPDIQKSRIILSAELLPVKKNYWIDLEHVRQLIGWDINLFLKNKSWISNHLSEKNCRLVTSWTRAGINTVIDNLPNSQNFVEKCQFVHNAVPSVKFKRKFEDKEKITFLFMSSYSLPYDFNFKGGNIALEAFSRLYEKNNRLRLIVKSWVPEDIAKKYSRIQGIEFQGVSPFSEMDAIFKQVDIFLSPNHNTPAQAFLDCMNYSIPVITTDLWANSEIIRDNYNGLLISKSKNIPYFFGNNIPNSRSPEFNKKINKVDEELVRELVDKAQVLIEKTPLRKKLGRNGKREIDSREFSIEKRNKKYKKLFDEYF